MKSSLLILAAGAAYLTTANAFCATTVISFGQTGSLDIKNSVNTYTPTGSEANRNIELKDTLGNAGLNMTLNGSWASAGAAGTFKPYGNVLYDGVSSSVINAWNSTYVSEYGQIWQTLANPNGQNEAATLTLAGLTANTTYDFTILSVRANIVYSGTGTYGFLYNGSATDVTTTLVAGEGIVNFGAGTISGEIGGGTGSNTIGANAREMKWSFTTGDDPGTAMLNLGGTNGNWNVNAIIISTTPIPEPSTYAFALAGVAGVAVLAARRRRKI